MCRPAASKGMVSDVETLHQGWVGKKPICWVNELGISPMSQKMLWEASLKIVSKDYFQYLLRAEYQVADTILLSC